MAMVITEEMKAKAEVYYGDEKCQEKSKFLLQEVGLPRGLLPLKDIIECGYIEETGFVWLKQKNKIEHVFEKIGRKVSYAPEITAYVEKFKIKKLTGVKAKELLVWLTLNEIQTMTFPSDAFELEEDLKEKKLEKEQEGVKQQQKTDVEQVPLQPVANK